MLLVQEQYVHGSRKTFDNNLHSEQGVSKKLFSDTNELWEPEFDVDEDVATSGDESDEEEQLLFEDPSEVPEETFEPRRQNFLRRKKTSKNLRFGRPELNYEDVTSGTSSVEEQIIKVDCGYGDSVHRRSIVLEPEIMKHKIKERFRVACKPKFRMVELNPEKSPSFSEGIQVGRKSVNFADWEEATEGRYRSRRKEHRCPRFYRDLDLDSGRGESGRRHSGYGSHKFECMEDSLGRSQRHEDWCDLNPLDEEKFKWDKKKCAKLKAFGSSHRHDCPVAKEREEAESKSHRKARSGQDSNWDILSLGNYGSIDRHWLIEDYQERGQTSKSKILEAVQEQQEQLSDSTYKIPCSKLSSQTIGGDLNGYIGKRCSDQLRNSSQTNWSCLGEKENRNSLSDKLRENPPRIHKMRSRRTRMNRLKSGWKKAFVQTVRDGSRNERVGLIVMGSEGPEFYSKTYKNSPGYVPFRKSKSFLEGGAKSFEVMTVDCKNVFLSSSEPGPRTNYAIGDLVCPEDDVKVEEKIAQFSKNVNEIVKCSEKKFYKTLSSSKGMLGEGEGRQDEEMKSSRAQKKEIAPDSSFIGQSENRSENETKANSTHVQLLPFDSFSRQRSSLSARRPGKKPTEESKVMADALNEQAKKYKENESELKEKKQPVLGESKDQQDKNSPEPMSREEIKANLSLWGMNLEEVKEKSGEKSESLNVIEAAEKEIEEETGVSSNDWKTDKSKGEGEKLAKDEASHSGSVKSIEQISINKQRRKKYYESTAGGSRNANRQTETTVIDEDSLGVSPSGDDANDLRCNNRAEKMKQPPEDLLATSENSEGLRKANFSVVPPVFRNSLVNSCTNSREASENLESIFNRASSNEEHCSNDSRTSSSSELISPIHKNKADAPPESEKHRVRLREVETRAENSDKKEAETMKKSNKRIGQENSEPETVLQDVNHRKVCKIKSSHEEKRSNSKTGAKSTGKQEEIKAKRKKKKTMIEEKMRLLREALPSIAAENEAAHLKQLKKYIDRFIDRVEASTVSEFRRRKEIQGKTKDSGSTDSSEVKVDAKKILDFVSDPFKKISSDVTINIAKKLTDALVQDKFSKDPKTFPGAPERRTNSDDDTDQNAAAFEGASSATERGGDFEPTYLKQLKRMRNEHLNNIVLEVKRLSELLRFLDRCNRLRF